MVETLSPKISLVKKSIDKLDGWIIDNGWAGYDPYDAKQHPLIAVLQPTFPKRLMQRALLLVESFFPNILRKLLNIKEEINPKAMGLFASGYLILYEVTNDEKYFDKAKEAIEWLLQNPSKGYRGLCWGQPFSWQSRIFIPKDTPSSVITAIVGDAFLHFYKMTGQSSYLTNCKKICAFFLNDLNIDRLRDSKICFSKTPLDHFHIHNSNLYVANFLLKVGNELQDANYIKTAQDALAYTLSEQNEDGSICYWGRNQDDKCRIDHYHSGFEIRSLYEIWKSTNDKKVYNSLKRYYEFYCGRMFTNEGIPKMTPKALFPINIHSCAEAILCHSTLAEDFPEAYNYLNKCVPWILQNMQHSDGYFIYMIRKSKGNVNWKVKIPYMRWGQAWMLRALSQYFTLLSDKKTMSPAGKEKVLQ